MSEAPVSLSFFDPSRQLHGIARAGLTLLFEGANPSAVGGVPEIETRGETYRAELEDRLRLEFEPVSEVAQLAGSRVRVCHVSGTVDGTPIDCLGTAAETVSPPEWDGLDALRAISALFDPGHALLAVARRPRGALGHGHELVSAVLVTDGELRTVEDARLSTIYDGDGRQRSASLELWLPGEDFPRRLSGSVSAGSSLELESVIVNAAVFRWRMDGREGAGEYNLTARNEPPAAA